MGVASVSVEAEASAVTGRGALPEVGETVSAAAGAESVAGGIPMTTESMTEPGVQVMSSLDVASPQIAWTVMLLSVTSTRRCWRCIARSTVRGSVVVHGGSS